MIFISKKKYEQQVRERVETELAKFFENQHKEDQMRELHKRMDYLVLRLEKVEDKVGIPHEMEVGFII